MSDTFDPDQEQARLDRLEGEIEQARHQVDDDTDVDPAFGGGTAAEGDLPAGGDRTFVDSGEEGDEFDDQTIAPPG